MTRGWKIAKDMISAAGMNPRTKVPGFISGLKFRDESLNFIRGDSIQYIFRVDFLGLDFCGPAFLSAFGVHRDIAPVEVYGFIGSALTFTK
jgi:hypothetical protein